jgi:hypothetical protein
MKYQIVGADRQTGEDVEIIVEANDEVTAESLASRRNIMVSRVSMVRLSQPPVVTRAVAPPPLEAGHVPNAPSINVHLPRRSSSLGIASFVLGIVAFLFCWIPLLNILSVPSGALGLILGIAGILVAFLRRGSGIGYCIAGSAMSGLALVVAFSITSTYLRETVLRDLRTNQEIVPMTDGAADQVATHSGTRAGPTASPKQTEVSWAPASEVVKQGDVQIRVVSAAVGKIKVQSTFSDTFEPSEPYLKIVLEVRNQSRTRKLDFLSWRNEGFSISRTFKASIRDSHDNTYNQRATGYGRLAENQDGSGSLYPGKSLIDVVVFEPPIANIEYLRLELPAENFGGDGMIRFEISAKMIQR